MFNGALLHASVAYCFVTRVIAIVESFYCRDCERVFRTSSALVKCTKVSVEWQKAGQILVDLTTPFVLQYKLNRNT
jgi:hypothetical protein